MTDEVEKKAATVIETVKMDDDRVVEFSGKQRVRKESSFDETNLRVRLDYRNGETRTFTIPHGYSDPTAPVAKMVLKAAAHGLEQKLGDEMSGVAVLEDAIEGVDQLMLRLEKGVDGWTMGKDGASGMAGASVLARALVKVTGQDIRVVREYLGGLDNKTKVALRADPTVSPVIKQIEEERAANALKRGKVAANSPVDTGSILAGLRKPEPLDAPTEGAPA